MSYIRDVERWREDALRRQALAKAGTDLYNDLQDTVNGYDNLLTRLRAAHEPKQKSLPMREPGDET